MQVWSVFDVATSRTTYSYLKKSYFIILLNIKKYCLVINFAQLLVKVFINFAQLFVKVVLVELHYNLHFFFFNTFGSRNRKLFSLLSGLGIFRDIFLSL